MEATAHPSPTPSGSPLIRWVDRLPWVHLLAMAILLGLAPFVPEPHLVEKLRMLFQGVLEKPIDIFDLFMHATPTLLVLIKGYRQYGSRVA